MKVYLGADHGGFAHKEKVKVHLREAGYSVEDCGAHQLDPDDDYPLFAKCVAMKVAEDLTYEARGVVFCRNGIGVSVVANKVAGVRAAHVMNEEIARTSRADDDTNVLAIPADYLSEDEVIRVVDTWLETEFSGEGRHKRRLKMITDMESGESESES